jgi:hypothetical protein
VVAQQPKVVRGDSVLVTRQHEQRRPPLLRGLDGHLQRRCQPLRPSPVDGHLDWQVGHDRAVPRFFRSQHDNHVTDVRGERTSTLAAQQWLAGDVHQLFRLSEPARRAGRQNRDNEVGVRHPLA